MSAYLMFFFIGSLCLLVFIAPPLWLLYYVQQTTGIWFRLPNHRNQSIAITIDDGPSLQSHLILDVLMKHQVPATFFLIGSRCQQFPEVMNKMIVEGHEIGNHDWVDRMSAQVPLANLSEAIINTTSLIPAPVHFFRPGCGWWNSEMLKLAKTLSLQVVLGDSYFHDPQLPWAWLQKLYMKWRVTPGSIIILHDAKQARVTAEVLDEVIVYWKAKGFTFTTLSKQLLGNRFNHE